MNKIGGKRPCGYELFSNMHITGCRLLPIDSPSEGLTSDFRAYAYVSDPFKQLNCHEPTIFLPLGLQTSYPTVHKSPAKDAPHFPCHAEENLSPLAVWDRSSCYRLSLMTLSALLQSGKKQRLQSTQPMSRGQGCRTLIVVFSFDFVCQWAFPASPPSTRTGRSNLPVNCSEQRPPRTIYGQTHTTSKTAPWAWIDLQIFLRCPAQGHVIDASSTRC